jgi:hypothetical protein
MKPPLITERAGFGQLSGTGIHVAWGWCIPTPQAQKLLYRHFPTLLALHLAVSLARIFIINGST